MLANLGLAPLHCLCSQNCKQLVPSLGIWTFVFHDRGDLSSPCLTELPGCLRHLLGLGTQTILAVDIWIRSALEPSRMLICKLCSSSQPFYLLYSQVRASPDQLVLLTDSHESFYSLSAWLRGAGMTLRRYPTSKGKGEAPVRWLGGGQNHIQNQTPYPPEMLRGLKHTL